MINNNWINKKGKLCPFNVCSVFSEIVLFNGRNNIGQDKFEEIWRKSNNQSYAPSLFTVFSLVKNKNIKWYIKNYINIIDKIWNGSFIHGISSCGKILWNNKSFPSFEWCGNENILDIFNNCPFYGELSEYKHKNGIKRYRWINSPALCLKYDKSDISFMAGVLATGKKVIHKDKTYASYNKKTSILIESWGIPIENCTKGKKVNLISPFWPALFSMNMPLCCSYWSEINNGYMTEIYSSILWRMYVSNNIVRNGIPYLKSRRWVYMNLGTTYETEKKWLELKLSRLDKRIKNIIHLYAKNV
jgi:hypothetical protein